MRVPIPVVILLIFSVIGGVWWTQTRDLDFLTAPSPARLEEIRLRVESSFPQTQHPGNAIAAPTPPQKARLNTPTPATVPMAVTLHASTGPSLAQSLEPILKEFAQEITQASSGTVKVRINISAGKSEVEAAGPRPIALWFSGATADSSRSDVRSFTIQSEQALHQTGLQILFKLIKGQLARTHPGSAQAPDSSEDADPKHALRTQISRADWQKFAKSMNQSPKSGE